MSSELQQHRAAAISARARRTRRLVRELSRTMPLTAEQKNDVLKAAANIPTLAAAR